MAFRRGGRRTREEDGGEGKERTAVDSDRRVVYIMSVTIARVTSHLRELPRVKPHRVHEQLEEPSLVRGASFSLCRTADSCAVWPVI